MPMPTTMMPTTHKSWLHRIIGMYAKWAKNNMTFIVKRFISNNETSAVNIECALTFCPLGSAWSCCCTESTCELFLVLCIILLWDCVPKLASQSITKTMHQAFFIPSILHLCNRHFLDCLSLVHIYLHENDWYYNITTYFQTWKRR